MAFQQLLHQFTFRTLRRHRLALLPCPAAPNDALFDHSGFFSDPWKLPSFDALHPQFWQRPWTPEWSCWPHWVLPPSLSFTWVSCVTLRRWSWKWQKLLHSLFSYKNSLWTFWPDHWMQAFICILGLPFGQSFQKTGISHPLVVVHRNKLFCNLML